MTAPWDADPGPDDDVTEGQVLPFPRPAGQPAPAPRKAAPGQRGELRNIIPEHLARPGRASARRSGGGTRRARHITPVSPGPGRPSGSPLTVVWAAVGVLRLAVAARLVVGHRAGVPAARGDRAANDPHLVPAAAQAGPRGPAGPRCRSWSPRTWPVLAAAARRHRAVPAGLAADRPAGRAVAGVDRPPGRQADRGLGRRPGGVRAADPEVIVRALGGARHRRDEQGAARGPGAGHRAGRPDHPRRPRLAGAGSTCRTASPPGQVSEKRERAGLRAAPPARLRVARDRRTSGTRAR